MNYYVNRNAQDDGYHEVHTKTCTQGPDLANRIQLGEHSDCSSAVKKAKTHYSQTDGCFYCCKSCHTR
jgi:hypothetical protein